MMIDVMLEQPYLFTFEINKRKKITIIVIKRLRNKGGKLHQ